MRESMIIYRSFYDAIKELEPLHQAEVWKAIFEYGLNNTQIELKGLPATIFTLIKPQLEANIRKYENGQKGGRPKKQKETKTKPNNNLTETKTKANVNDNVNDTVNDNKELEEEFETVWSLYQRKGNKKKSSSIWNRLSKTTKDKIKQHIPIYIKNHTDNDKINFLPHFTTYLNGEVWNDELPYKQTETVKTTPNFLKL